MTIELMNLFWSTAGIYPGTGTISPIDFETRVRYSARAGFKGIGLWHADLEHNFVNRSLREMKAILDDNGITQLELEFLTDWFVAGARRRESDMRRKLLLEASAVLGAHHIKVGDFYNTPASMPQLIDSFATLCEDAAEFDATIGYEFMGSATLSTLRDSLTMVEGAGARNGGLIVDIAHVTSLGISPEEVSRIPVQRLVSVELNDGYPPGHALHDPSQRRFCGEGAFDIPAFIEAVKSTGYSGPWAVELFADHLTGLPQDELNRRAFETTTAFFSA